MKQQYIFLVFTKTGTWLSRTLNFFENSDYIHVSLGLDNPLNNLYSFGRTNPSNPFSGFSIFEEETYWQDQWDLDLKWQEVWA